MKKMMTVLAACAIASFSLAAGDVTSANIVGYSGKSLEKGFNMVGVNFVKIGATDKKISLQSLMNCTGLTAVDWDTVTGGDQLYIWDPSVQGYPAIYSWTGTNADTLLSTTGVSSKWVDLNTFDGTSATVPELNVSAGSAVWIQRTGDSDASVVFLGQIEIGQMTTNLLSGFNMIAGPKPVVLDLNDSAKITFTGLAAVDWDTVTGGDQLYIWSSSLQGYPAIYSWTGADADTILSTTGVSSKWVDLNVFDGTSATVPVLQLQFSGAAWILRTTGTAATVNYTALAL